MFVNIGLIMKKALFVGVLIMIIFLVGCSKLTFKSSGVKTYSCTEGWMRTNDYAGQVNSVGDAKNIYLARLKFEDLSRFNLTNITIIERNFTNQKGDIVFVYEGRSQPKFFGRRMLGKDGYWYTYRMCG